jgi:hypothetical protein
MWPVGFSGGSLYETPIVKQGKVILFSVFYLFRPYGSLGSSMMEAGRKQQYNISILACVDISKAVMVMVVL